MYMKVQYMWGHKNFPPGRIKNIYLLSLLPSQTPNRLIVTSDQSPRCQVQLKNRLSILDQIVRQLISLSPFSPIHLSLTVFLLPLVWFSLPVITLIIITETKKNTSSDNFPSCRESECG